MLSCDEAAAYIVRLSDEEETLDAASRALLDAHVAACADCRSALETQREVAGWLRSRPVDRVPDEFAARLSRRLDEDARTDQWTSWLGIADWRVWTLRLAPLAVLLLLFGLLGSSADAQPTLDDWALGNDDGSSAAALLLQSDVSSDSLAESLVTGELPSGAEGAGDVRQ